MTTTYTLKDDDRPLYVGDKRARLVEANITSYTTGGDLLRANDAGLSQIDFVIGAGGAASYVVKYDPATGTIKAYTGGAEVTAATNVGKQRFLVVGH